MGVLVPTLIEVDGTVVTLEPGVTAAENRKIKVWTICMERLHEETNLILQKNSTDDIYIQTFNIFCFYFCVYYKIKTLASKKYFLKYQCIYQLIKLTLYCKENQNLIYQ